MPAQGRGQGIRRLIAALSDAPGDEQVPRQRRIANHSAPLAATCNRRQNNRMEVPA
ncbi:MAG TPA: hypothetical protein VGA75_08005 [Paracoccaceae bacterium]